MICLAALLIILTDSAIQVQGSGISRRYKNSRSLVKDVRQDGYYDFHYLIDHENSHQYRKETRKDGKVTGSYGIIEPDGRKRMVYYVADEDGFRAKIDTNEPGVLPVNPANIELSKSENVFKKLTKKPQDATSTSLPDTMHMYNIDHQEISPFFNEVHPYVYHLPSFDKPQDGADNELVSYSVHINHDEGNPRDSYSPNNISPHGYSSSSWKMSKPKKSQDNTNENN